MKLGQILGKKDCLVNHIHDGWKVEIGNIEGQGDQLKRTIIPECTFE
jgi:hypothetical protein